MNDYEFWNNYLNTIRNKVLFLCQNNKELKVDLHIHTNNSTDSNQTLNDAIEKAKKYNIDIISLTDHDSLNVYNELYELFKEYNLNNFPIIIPGIEHTIDFSDYGSQCHLLQYMINPKDEVIINDVTKSQDAYYIRAKKQFERIKNNLALQYFFKKYNIECTYENYMNYLNNGFPNVPEYYTLINYILSLLIEKNITVIDIFNKLEEFNLSDECEERRFLKAKRYKELKEKYSQCENLKNNSRLLLSLLAVREVDDDWWKNYESSGSLSVNSYNQIKIAELNKNYSTVFAHPTESKLCTIEEAIKLNSSIIGLEKNIRTHYNNVNAFFEVLNQNNLILTKGSDSHLNNDTYYKDENFFRVSSNQVRHLVLGGAKFE